MKPKVQVVACRCCTEMPELLDMNELMSVASSRELVVSSMLVDRLCDGKTAKEAALEAKDREVDRVAVLACSKKDVTPALLAAYKKAKINEGLVEFVDLRDEVVLPHLSDKKRAQAKAETKALAAIDKLLVLKPLMKHKEKMRTKNVVVLGGGASGRKAAETAAREGAHTVIIEKSDRSFKAPGVIMPRAVLMSAKGYGGNYVLSIKAGEKMEELECAAIVIATGGGWTELKGPLAKACKAALPLYRLEEQMQSGTKPAGPVVIVDTPDPTGKHMKTQDFAWAESLDLAIKMKKADPNQDIIMVFQEMRAFGLSELEYKEAADLGVRFVRYDKSGTPKIDPKEPTHLTVKDLAQGEVLRIPFGTLAFASIPSNRENEGIADTLRIPMSAEGGIRRGSMQRGPVSTPRPGIFVCGSALFPKSREVAESEGEAAGIMAAAYVSKGEIEYGGVVAEVTPEKCSACLTCVRTCPYEAPFIGAASKAEIRTQLCQGCGMCVGICPSKAIELHGYTDEQIELESRAMLGGDF
jgi:heterodisulfide reductase subunit A-like polyferredoxin